jgi:hypothetical protein
MSQLNFKKYLAEQAQKDSLPFDLDFEFLHIESENFTEVAGYRINLINDLSVAESWFLELLQNQINILNRDFRTKTRYLVGIINEALGMDDASLAADYLTEGMPLVPPTDAFTQEEWDVKRAILSNVFDTYADQITELGQLYKLLTRNHTVDMMMVTFFMMTRHDTSWVLAKTATLPLNTIDAIKEIIFSEARRGADPEEGVEDEEETEAGKIQ